MFILSNLFGTTGIRKEFSSYDKNETTFTPSIALRLGLAIGTYINSGTVVVGRDIRLTARPIELALTSGLISTGCHVLSIGMVTTPTLAMSIDYLNADCGVMITASHNPPEYIGLKLWNKKGLGFDSKQEKRIEEIYTNRAFLSRAWDQIGTVTEIQDINTVHINEVLKRIAFPKTGRRFNIILDPGNGSSCEIVPQLVNRLGFKYITLNSQPDGRFPGRLSEPSDKNIHDLKDFVKFSKDVELGIALDGDADRVVFIDGNGKEIDAIRVLTFLAKEYLKENPQLPVENRIVVTPLNSSGVVEHILNPMGVKVIRTQVGDIKVSLEIQRSGGFLGGETAGTYIWPFFHLGPDSIMTIVLLLKYLSQYDQPFEALINQIPDFPFLQTQYELSPDKHFSRIDYEKIYEILRPDLKSANFHNIIESYFDGLRVNFDEGWILIRKSGTTPIVRINAESKTDMKSTIIMRDIAENALKSYISVKKLK